MSQNDFSVANADGATVRADMNSGFQALAGKSSGTAAPSTTYAYQSWWDTTTGILKFRDAANGTFLPVGTMGTGGFIPLTNGTAFATATVIGQIVGTMIGTLATGTTTIPSDDTIPTSSEGTEFMSLAFTPTNASSTLIIDVDSQLSSNLVTGSNGIISGALYVGTAAAAAAAAQVYQDNGAASRRLSFTHIMSAGSTSARTFKFRAGHGGGTATVSFNGISGTRIFGGICASSIKVTEVLP